MSLLSALSTSLAGLQTASAQMQMVSDNLANAGVTGYTEKTAVLKSVTFGNGSSSVIVSGYTRATDDVTLRSLMSANSESGSLGASDDYLQQVENILGSISSSSSTSLADYMTSFSTAWSSLEAEPESATTQTAVVSAGKNLANAVQTIATSVQTLSTSVKSDINTTLSTLNSDLAQVAQLNKQIASANSTGQPTGDLEDSRDQLVLDISKIAKVTVMKRGDGSISIYTTGGYQLLDSQAQQFSYDGANVVNANSPTVSANSALVGGSLEAELNFIDPSLASSSDAGSGVVTKITNMLNSVVSAFTSWSAGPPETFSHAYNSATPHDSSLDFFTGTNSTNFAVNANLLSGTSPLLTTTATTCASVTDALSASDRSFPTPTTLGMSASSYSYKDLISNILSYYQQSASSVSSQASAASSQTTYLTTELSNNTGVSSDKELVKLTSLENSYNASAKVVSVVNSMLQTLMGVI